LLSLVTEPYACIEPQKMVFMRKSSEGGRFQMDEQHQIKNVAHFDGVVSFFENRFVLYIFFFSTAL